MWVIVTKEVASVVLTRNSTKKEIKDCFGNGENRETRANVFCQCQHILEKGNFNRGQRERERAREKKVRENDSEIERQRCLRRVFREKV